MKSSARPAPADVVGLRPPSRRAILTGAAAVATTLPVAAAPLNSADAALVQLWSRYAAACRTQATLGADMTADQKEAAWAVIETLRSRIEATLPAGRRGIAVHLRVLLIDLAGSLDVTVDSFGGSIPESIAGDWCLDWLWNLAVHLGGDQQASATIPA